MTTALVLPMSTADGKVIDLGFRPRPWQAECFRRLKRWSVLVVHRRGGKSVFGVMLLIDRALRFVPQPGWGPGRFFYVAPEKAQAKGVSWDYLKRFASPVPGVKINEAELSIDFPNGSRIKVEGADDPDRLRGVYIDGIVLDELADMKPQTWGEVVRPALADREGWALFIGTPKGTNLLSEMFFAAQHDPSWYAARLTVNDTGAIKPEELEQARRQMSESQYAQEFLCDFAAGNSNALLSVHQVEEACRRTILGPEIERMPRIIGVDVARQGDDRTCIFRRQGLMAWPPHVMRGADAMQVAGHVAKHMAEWKPDAVFIDGSGGYGAGVIDRLRSMGHICTEVQFGGKAGDDRFVNKRTEMWWELAEWVKGGGAIPNLPELKLDLCAPTYDLKTDRLRLESKDNIKARGLPSPDLGDALALTFAYPVAPRGLLVTSMGVIESPFADSPRALTEYDPFA